MLRKLVIVLIVILITSFLWVSLTIYLSYSSLELKTEILGSKNVYEFLSKGMLDEVKVTAEEVEEVEGVSVDILEPIDPYFSKVGFEKVVEKIKLNLIVPPLEFHQLQNEAVMRVVEDPVEEEENLDLN